MDPRDLEIVKYPDPVLKRTAKPLLEIDDDVRARVRRMIELMYRDKGVGLAAPQIGWSVRLFVMNPSGPPAEARVIVNPVVATRSRERERSNEGCLSIPDVNGKIERHVRVTLEAYDLEGTELALDLEGFPARVCQHELDHLDGVLITDRMSPAERSVAEPRLRELKRRYEEEKADQGARR